MRVPRVIPALVAAFLLTTQAFAQLVVGPELHVGKDIVSSSQAYEIPGGVAWNGTNGLAVWTEARDQHTVIIATRLSADGTPLDPDGIVLLELAPTIAHAVTVARNGDGYLLLWSTPTTLFSSPLSIDSTGHATLAHAEGIVVASASDLIDVRVAAAGDRLLALYEDIVNDGTTASAVLLDHNGNPLTGSIPIDAAILFHSRVASNGSTFAVTTANPSWGTTLAIFDLEGHITSRTVITRSLISDITTIGPAYLVAWSLDRSIGDVIVAPDGSINSTSFNTIVPTGADTLGAVSVAFNGSEGLALYEVLGARGCSRCVQASVLRAAHFGPDGKAIDQPFAVVNDPLSDSGADVVWTGSDFVGVYLWQNNMFGVLHQLRSVAIGRVETGIPADFVSTPTPLLRSVTTQSAVASSNGREVLVVTSELGESTRLFVGEHELPNPASINVSIASDGSGWLVVWTGSDGAPHASLFNSARQFVSDTVLSLPINGVYVVAFDGSEYVVVGSDATGVRAVRVLASGLALDDPPIVLMASDAVGAFGRIPPPAVTGFRGRTLVSITIEAPDCFCNKLLTWKISGSSVTAGNAVPTDIAYAPDSTNDGTDAFVIGEQGHVFRVDGTTAQATLIANDPNGGGNTPTIARRGAQLLVVWSDGTSESLSRNGALAPLDLRFPVDSRLFRTPDASAAGVTYSRETDEPPYNGAEVSYLRLLLSTRGRITMH